ncbi:uncharacterized protein LOC144887320 isoform X2 [Branchiostoma floridae x Branchiostoma japonicum]
MMAPKFPSLSASLVLLGCLLIVTESGAQRPVVTVTNSGNVQVFPTETANLTCNYESTVPLTIQSVSWYKLDENGREGQKLLTHVTNNGITESVDRLAELSLTGRVSYPPDLTYMAIQETVQSDSGTYRCKVTPILPEGDAAYVDTNLTVIALPGTTTTTTQTGLMTTDGRGLTTTTIGQAVTNHLPGLTTTTMTTTTIGQAVTNHLPDCSCLGAGTVAGAAVGCLAAGLLLGVAATLMIQRSRKAQPDDAYQEEYVDVRTPNRTASQRSGTGNNDDYEIPMEPHVSLPPPSGHYQELQPAVYQSLQKN